MCLAIPGKILAVEGVDSAFRTGIVDFRGIEKQVDLALTPEVESGDFVLVHAGFAISRVDPEEAARIYENLEQIAALEAEEPAAGLEPLGT